MKHSMIIVLSLIAALAIGGIAQAAPIPVTTNGTDFLTLEALLGGSLTPVTAPLVSDFSGGHLSASVMSQAYKNADGSSYLYLYQLRNDAASQDVITRFTSSPYTGANNQVSLGYLNANIPAGFSLGYQTPLYGDVNTDGATVGFNFPVAMPWLNIPDSYIAPGKDSKVLYIESKLAPGLVIGNVINGGVHANSVIGPVPEPGTLVLLVTAGLALLGYTWRRRQS